MIHFPLLLALTMPSFAQQEQPPRSVAGMRDQYRPVLVFQSAKDARLYTQLSLLAARRSELIDRQIMLDVRPYTWNGVIDDGILTFRTWEEDKALRLRFHIRPDDFTVILLGKDGGEKFRAHTLITIDQLTRVIDAMPMRQSEIRAQSKH